MAKLVLFGDSITAGFFDEPASPILTNLVKEGLEAQKITDIAIINAGIPGDTTSGGLKRMEKDVLSKEPDMVTIFFGANDCSDSRPIDVQEYGENLSQMINSIGKEKVVLFTPPFVDSARQPDRQDEEIRRFVAKAKEIGEQQEVPVVDIYHAMTVYPGTDEFLQPDGLHFSEVGYEFLAALIVREIKGKRVK
ncbi:GDSL-type esterase/lipase family protein [Enterococcus sp. CWB-B31]|uniref:GDSL-type esterase/lipase family protein n=1 Tax=Enterococcus sp. CWB-B31 TaxID=2885159 RepID=UPI001E2FB420|nr:GDSL-type esterase/lipase family protein [Enterococcus sp. CWB-B31]MCB5956361.1 GDSL-type esterase/lipase family protein [Enterococcus sp. CWB-B31]